MRLLDETYISCPVQEVDIPHEQIALAILYLFGTLIATLPSIERFDLCVPRLVDADDVSLPKRGVGVVANVDSVRSGCRGRCR